MKRACDLEGPSAGKRAALTVRLNVGGRFFDTTRETLSSCPFFEHCLAERGCQMAEDDDGRIFLDRDGDLFRILLQAIRTGARPPQATVAIVSTTADGCCFSVFLVHNAVMFCFDRISYV